MPSSASIHFASLVSASLLHGSFSAPVDDAWLYEDGLEAWRGGGDSSATSLLQLHAERNPKKMSRRDTAIEAKPPAKGQVVYHGRPGWGDDDFASWALRRADRLSSSAGEDADLLYSGTARASASQPVLQQDAAPAARFPGGAAPLPVAHPEAFSEGRENHTAVKRKASTKHSKPADPKAHTKKKSAQRVKDSAGFVDDDSVVVAPPASNSTTAVPPEVLKAEAEDDAQAIARQQELRNKIAPSPKAAAAAEATAAANAPQADGPQVWKYEPFNKLPLAIRSEPSATGARTDVQVYPGDRLEISEEREGEHGVTYLKLADGRGWLFDRYPSGADGVAGGQMCVRTVAVTDEYELPDAEEQKAKEDDQADGAEELEEVDDEKEELLPIVAGSDPSEWGKQRKKKAAEFHTAGDQLDRTAQIEGRVSHHQIPGWEGDAERDRAANRRSSRAEADNGFKWQGHRRRFNVERAPRPTQAPEDIGHLDDDEGKVRVHPRPRSFLEGNWELNTVKFNNLGSLGPDFEGPEGIRYGEITEVHNGRYVDLLVNAASKPYVPHYSSKNGLHGSFGNINLYNNNSIDLVFHFIDSESGEPVEMPGFHITVFDLDQGPYASAKEFLTVDGFDEAHLMAFTSLNTRGLADGRREFSSTVHGTGENNPVDPLSLTEHQAAHAVDLVFPAGLSEFKMNYAVGEARAMGRNMLFAGMSSLSMCQERPLNLNFEMATVVYNNLGGKGPDTGVPEGIRYHNLLVVNGMVVDLIVNSAGFYKPWNVPLNGLYGKFGNINIAQGETVDLAFRFVEAETSEPVTLKAVHFSIFDLDEGQFTRLRESLTIGGFVAGYLTDDTEIEMQDLPDGRVSYSSSRNGHGPLPDGEMKWPVPVNRQPFRSDNPEEPMHLTKKQLNKAVTFLFHDSSEFVASFSVEEGPRDQGRNFLFGGKSSVVFC